METAIIYRITVPKGIKILKIKRKKTREERDEYIRQWQALAIDLGVKP